MSYRPFHDFPVMQSFPVSQNVPALAEQSMVFEKVAVIFGLCGMSPTQDCGRPAIIIFIKRNSDKGRSILVGMVPKRDAMPLEQARWSQGIVKEKTFASLIR